VKRRIWIVPLLLWGCRSDVLLGAAPKDAIAAASADAAAPDAEAPDAAAPDANAVDAGAPDGGEPPFRTYALEFRPRAFDALCMDGLAGREAAFRTITATQAGLIEGEIAFEYDRVRSRYRAFGSVVTSNFGAHELSLEMFPEDPGIYYSQPDNRSGPAGPLGTQLVALGLGLDANTLTATSGLAAALIFYARSATTSDGCQVIIEADLGPQ
jgi:hypothetical protein